MKSAITRRLFVIVMLSGMFLFAQSQGNDTFKNLPKPYRILTSGKQITVRSSEDIKSVMVWTASGHRIIEQKDINASSYSFRVNVAEKVFFVMLELKGDKRYTEKIGVQ